MQPAVAFILVVATSNSMMSVDKSMSVAYIFLVMQFPTDDGESFTMFYLFLILFASKIFM